METIMKFRETKAWFYTKTVYWIAVFATAAAYYWFGFFKDFL